MICHVYAARALAQDTQVVCVDPHNTELVARITGQTRDLPIRVRWVESTLHAPPTEAELRALAQRYSADFAVAFRAVAGSHSVYVYSAKARALRTREVPRPARGERFSNSAASEAVALIVRGELSAALASLVEPAAPAPEDSSGPGGTPSATTSGPATSSAHAPPPTPDKPAPPPAKPRQKPVERAPPPPEAPEPEEPEQPDAGPQPSAAEIMAAWFAPPLRISLAANMRASIPAPDHVFGSPTLQLQFKLAHLGLALHGSTSFPARFADDAVAITLHRHAAQLELFAWFKPSENVEISLGPAAGAVFYERATEQSTLITSTPGRVKMSPNVSALAEVRWHFAHRVGLSVCAGLDFILRRVTYSYAASADPAQPRVNTLARLAEYEPWVAAGLFVDIAE